jgi:hypothetical protein
MASVRARPRLRGQPGGLRDGVIGGVAGDQCQPEETDGAVIINVGSADLEEMSVGQLRGDEIRTAEVWLGSGAGRRSLPLSDRYGLLATPVLALAAAAMPAAAYCGKQCKEARTFCSHWEKDHPGEECGRVRGASCNAPGSHGTWSAAGQQAAEQGGGAQGRSGQGAKHGPRRRGRARGMGQGHRRRLHEVGCKKASSGRHDARNGPRRSSVMLGAWRCIGPDRGPARRRRGGDAGGTPEHSAPWAGPAPRVGGADAVMDGRHRRFRFTSTPGSGQQDRTESPSCPTRFPPRAPRRWPPLP